jgi:hypothetical protein
MAEDSQIDNDVLDMARRSYGYGTWDAPYWFIGPEPGQTRYENDDLNPRVKAWLRLGGHELCDCRKFHEFIGEMKWHGERPRLQQTWRRLMLSLMTFHEMEPDKETLRTYQRDQWGRLGGETCVIELSGLAANNSTVSRRRELFQPDRIKFIRNKIRTINPTFVVMYGARQKKSWEEIAGSEFPSEGILRIRSTIFAFAPHPICRGSTDAFWKELGKRLLRETHPS